MTVGGHPAAWYSHSTSPTLHISDANDCK